MASFYIDPVERARIVTLWVKITLTLLHIWASVAVIGGLCHADKEVCIAIFKTCTFGIGGTLIILLLDRAGDVLLNKFSSATIPMASTQTVTTTVTPASIPNTEAKDINIKASGDINVNGN